MNFSLVQQYQIFALVAMSLFGMIGLYNLILYFVIRNKIYVYYCLLVLGFTCHVSLMLFRDDYYALGASLSVVTASFTVFSSILFSRAFLKISKQSHPKLNSVFKIIAGLVLSIFILQLLNMLIGVNIEFEESISVAAAIMALVAILLEFSTATFLWKAKREARIFLATNLPVLIGATVYTIKWFSLSDTNLATTEQIDIAVYIMFGTVLIQMILFSIVIGYSLRHLEEEKYELQKNYTQQLEAEVDAQTRTLQKAKEQIESANEKLVQNSKFKNKLFSLIAHDLRAPLTSLMGLVQVLEMGEMSKKEISDFVDYQKEKIDDCIQILNRVLKWSYAQLDQVKVQKEETSIKKIVQESISVYSSLIDSKDVQIATDIQSDRVLVDTEIISTIVRNLLSNAIKFSHHNGVITIRSISKGDKTIFSIRDEGIGMPIDQLGQLNSEENIFTQEGTEGEKGQGFGLIISKDFVEMNGGKLTCESEPGKGTTFFIELESASVES